MDWPARKRLNKKQYDGLCEEVESYFEEVRKGKLTQADDQLAIDDLYSRADRFLREACFILANVNDPLHQELEGAIESCCRGYGQLYQLTTVNDARVQSDLKTILYIISKLVGKANPATFVTLSHTVLKALRCVQDLHTKTHICDTIPSFFSFLWNASITLERRPDITPRQVCLVRLSSLRLLAQLPSKRESCLEKLLLALSVLEYQSRRVSGSSEGVLKKEEPQGEKKSAGVHKSKTTKNKPGKKGSDIVSENAGKVEERSDGSSLDEFVLPLVFDTLEDVLRGGYVSAVLVLKLILTLYDVFASCKIAQDMDEVKGKVTSLVESSSCPASSEMILHVLDPLWALINITEHVCEDSAALSFRETDLKCRFISAVNWCRQKHLRTPVEKRCFVELFHWFTKQIKNRKTKSCFLLQTDLLVQLLSIFQESQNFFVENGASLVEGEGIEDTAKQEWQEKLIKTHFDAHRCWMALFSKALTENPSALQNSVELKRLVDKAESQLAAYVAAIDKAAHCPALEQSERYSVGSVCVRVGHVWYNQGRDDRAIVYYDLACQQLVLWCQADPQHYSARLKEVSLLKLYNCLSQGLLKAGRVDEALGRLQLAVEVGGAQLGGEELTMLMKTWLKLKRAAFKEGGENMDTRLARCLVDEEKSSAETVCHYLQLELNWLLKGGRLWLEEGAMLKRLRETTPVSGDRDVYRLLLLQFDVTNHTAHIDREEREECLQHIASTYPDITLLQMEVHLIRFYLKVKDRVDELAAEPAEEEPTGSQTEAETQYSMVGEEERELLRAALTCWSRGVSSKGVEGVVGETMEVFGRMMVEMTMVVADVLLACRQFLLQLEMVLVVKQIDQHSHWDISNSAKHDIDRSLLEALAGVGVGDLPQTMIDTVTSMGAEKGAEPLRLSLIHFYLKGGKVEEACTLLHSLRDREQRGELGTLVRGKYCRLWFQSLMTMAPGLGLADDYLLPFIQNAYRAHFSVFGRTESADGAALRPGSQNSNFSHWVKLVELLESTFSLGTMYRHIGDSKRARCYLKDGLTLCRKFGLLKWSAVFGIELCDVMCDVQSLQALVSTLSATHTSLNALESPADSSPQSSNAQSDDKPACLKPRSVCDNDKTDIATEDLVKDHGSTSQHDSTSQLTCDALNKGGNSDAPCEGTFWQKVQSYTKMEEEKRSQLEKDISDTTSVILAWSVSLVSHPVDCPCSVCTDAETQCLALTLVKTSLKVIHTSATADLQLEHFIKATLTRLRKVDTSKKVTRILRSAGVVGRSEKVDCGNSVLAQCVVEVCSLLVESMLHHHHLLQALAHAKAGVRALKHLPLHCSGYWTMKSHMVYLHAVCVHRSRCLHPVQGKGDWKDAWCFLPEAQLEVQIRNKLDQLKIKVSSHKKTEKVSPSSETPVICQSRKGLVDSSKEALSDCKVSSSEHPHSLKSSSEKTSGKSSSSDKSSSDNCSSEISSSEKSLKKSSEKSSSEKTSSKKSFTNKSSSDKSSSQKRGCQDSTPNEHGVCSSENPQSSDSVCGKVCVEDLKESPCELVKSSHTLPDKDNRERSPSEQEGSWLLADKDSAVKTNKQSGGRDSDTSSCGDTDMPTPPESGSQRPAKLKSSQHCKSAKADQQSRSLSPKPADSESRQTSEQNSQLPAKPSRPAQAKGKPATSKSVAQGRRKPNKTAAALAKKSSYKEKSSETESALFTEESIVTKLFPESTTSEKADGQKESITNRRKVLLSQSLTPSLPKTPKTPGSVLQQTLTFKCLSDSGDEFQPTTPKSTPRLAGWLKGKCGQSKRAQDTTTSDCLKLTRVVNSFRRARAAPKKGLCDESSDPANPPAASGDGEHQSVVPLPPEKTKPAAKSGKKATSKRKGAAAEVVSVETLQQKFAKLDVSKEKENVDSSNGHRLPEDSFAPVGQEEVSAPSRRGRREQGGTVQGNMDRENITSKARTTQRQPAKVLSPVNNILETRAEKKEECKGVLQPLEEEVDTADASWHKRGRSRKDIKPSSQARKNKRVKTGQSPVVVQKETDVPQTTRGRKTTRKGGVESTEMKKPVTEPSRSTRGAAARASKTRNTDQIVLEIEAMRGRDDPPESDTHRDIFEFEGSDGETESSQTSRTGRRGRQTKIPVAKTAKPSRQAAGRTASAKASYKPKSVASKHKTVPCTTASKNSTVIPKLGGRDGCKHPSLLTPTSSKETSLTNSVSTLHTDLTSIETLRMGDLTCMMSIKEEKNLVRDPSTPKKAPDCSGKGGDSLAGKGDSTLSDWTLQTVQLLDSLLRQGEEGVGVDDDGGDNGMDSLIVSTAHLTLTDCGEDSLGKAQANLTESLSQIQHFPHVTTFSDSSKLVAQIKLDQGGDPWEIAALLSESAAVSLRHQFLAYYHKHVRAVESQGTDKTGSGASELRDNIQELLFPWDMHRFREVVHTIPQGWTVCQFSVVDSPGSPTLLLTRLTCDQEPLTVELPHFFDSKGQSIYFGFKDILKVNDEVQKIKDNGLWWRHRATLEVKLANLLEGMEKHWLGCWKGLLGGQTSDGDYNTAMRAAASTLVTLLRSRLGCSCSLDTARQALELMQHTKDIATILSHLLQRDDVVDNAQLLSDINAKVIDTLPKVTEADLPVVLILDKQLTNFPIELLSVMRNQSVTRVPSLSLFHHLLRRHNALGDGGGGATDRGVEDPADSPGSLMVRGVDPTAVFYLMNPDGDLVKSQQFLEPLFQSKEKWQGIAGVAPTKEQYEQALTQHDLFVYCGHGNGCKYFSIEDLLKTRCRAVPLLFGCASVRLDTFPHLDAEGYFYSYLLAGSPCVLGNLWDVTDRDIDAFGMGIFNQWLKGDDSDPKPSLASLVQQSRSVCRMPLLNGGAPVLYGLPVPLLRPSG